MHRAMHTTALNNLSDSMTRLSSLIMYALVPSMVLGARRDPDVSPKIFVIAPVIRDNIPNVGYIISDVISCKCWNLSILSNDKTAKKKNSVGLLLS